MIGCEKLCNACEACAPLVWALQEYERRGPDGFAAVRLCAAFTPFLLERPDAVLAVPSICDPAALAKLLARALVGRGVDADVLDRNAIDEHPDPDVLFSPDGDGIVYDANGITCGAVLTLPEARAALRRVIALPIYCGPAAALEALG